MKRNTVSMIGAFIAWVARAAIPLDAVKNMAKLRMLDDRHVRSLGRWGTPCPAAALAAWRTPDFRAPLHHFAGHRQAAPHQLRFHAKKN
ncbi:MAG: hypothetical protein JSR40_03010 [Proteobacteria bacterium]|nr:hypothetical protein [Pseudomonadota bacterium]